MAVSMAKEYLIDFNPGAWIHFRFRMLDETLLGANMYTLVEVDGVALATIGINGAQHWVQGANCSAKTNDDEFFVSLKEAPDTRVAYPSQVAGTKPYTQWWTIFSLKYEQAEGVYRVRIFVDGWEIAYRNIDNPPPNGQFSTNVGVQPGPTSRRVKITMATMTDGDLYADTSDGGGYRWLHCYAAYSPAVPTPLVSPPAPAKLLWMNQFDAVVKLWPDPSTKPANLEGAIWQGIFGGTVSLEAAVLLGAIPLPPPDHVQWQYEGPGRYEQVKAELEAQNSCFNPSLPLRKRWPWHNVKAGGGAALAVHYGYISPEEMRHSAIWSMLSSQEQSQIPAPAAQRDSNMEWDFVIIGNGLTDHSMLPAVKQLIYAGKISTSTALFLELISWSDAQFNCQYMSPGEISQVRTHPLGSPRFCPER
jgi:hypothetical protein